MSHQGHLVVHGPLNHSRDSLLIVHFIILTSSINHSFILFLFLLTFKP